MARHIPYRARGLLAMLLVLGAAQAATVLAADPDSLVLRNGDRLSGTVVEITPEQILLSTSHSGLLRVDKSALQQLNISSDLLTRLRSAEKASVIAGANEAVSTPSDATLAGLRGKGDKVGESHSDSKDTQSKAVPLGLRPEDEADLRKLFLRQSSVLLAPGQLDVEVAGQYQRTRTDSAVLSELQRELSLTLGARYGLTDNWQGYLNLPVSYGYQEFSFGSDESSARHQGIGDLSAGLSYQIRHEGKGWPDLVATVGVTAPTGRSPYADGGSGVALGAGHWSATAGLQFIKTADPVALFGGISLTHHVARDAQGKRIQPGKAFGYNLGLSFAINESVSVSGEFIGNAQASTHEDGVRFVGSAREPMQFRTGLIYRLGRNWYLAPTLNYGLNRDAPDVMFGLASSHRID